MTWLLLFSPTVLGAELRCADLVFVWSDRHFGDEDKWRRTLSLMEEASNLIDDKTLECLKQSRTVPTDVVKLAARYAALRRWLEQKIPLPVDWVGRGGEDPAIQVGRFVVDGIRLARRGDEPLPTVSVDIDASTWYGDSDRFGDEFRGAFGSSPGRVVFGTDGLDVMNPQQPWLRLTSPRSYVIAWEIVRAGGSRVGEHGELQFAAREVSPAPPDPAASLPDQTLADAVPLPRPGGYRPSVPLVILSGAAVAAGAALWAGTIIQHDEWLGTEKPADGDELWAGLQALNASGIGLFAAGNVGLSLTLAIPGFDRLPSARGSSRPSPGSSP